MACESLRQEECTLALAGGVNLILAEDSMDAAAAQFGGLSPDGRCYTFDARANGFIRGEGGGAVLLKPLAAALRDGDPVYCVIRGSAVNNDGATDGLTVPSPAAQEDVLRRAYERAGVAPGPDRPLLAGVSSFGMGGTNCHVVLAQAPAPTSADAAPAARAAASTAAAAAVSPGIPWLLAGKSPAALRAQAGRLREHLAAHPDLDPADVGYSLATTRSAFTHRAVPPHRRVRLPCCVRRRPAVGQRA